MQLYQFSLHVVIIAIHDYLIFIKIDISNVRKQLWAFSWQLPIFAVATSQGQPAGLLRATASDLNVLQPELCLQLNSFFR